MLKRLSMLALFVATVSGCSNEGALLEFQIDNPTDTSITLNIDGQDYPVPAHGETPVRLSPGEHHLRSERLGDVRVIVYTKQRGGLINPTLSDYVRAMQVYVTGDDKLKNFGPRKSRIELGGVEFEGPFSKTHDLFIDKDWTFGVHEPFPKILTVQHIDKNGGDIKSKIFTVSDLIRYIEDGSGQSGAYLKRNPAGFVQPQHTLEPAPAELPPLHADYEAHAGPLRSLYARYLKAATADEQFQLQKELLRALGDLNRAMVPLNRNLPVEAHQAYEKFALTLTRTLSSSALVIPAH